LLEHPFQNLSSQVDVFGSEFRAFFDRLLDNTAFAIVQSGEPIKIVNLYLFKPSLSGNLLFVE
jgi:hypothetical protein